MASPSRTGASIAATLEISHVRSLNWGAEKQTKTTTKDTKLTKISVWFNFVLFLIFVVRTLS